MKSAACWFFGFVVSYMFLAGLWQGGHVTWITIVGIAFSARFIVAAVFGFLFAYLVS